MLLVWGPGEGNAMGDELSFCRACGAAEVKTNSAVAFRIQGNIKFIITKPFNSWVQGSVGDPREGWVRQLVGKSANLHPDSIPRIYGGRRKLTPYLSFDPHITNTMHIYLTTINKIVNKTPLKPSGELTV